MQPFIDACVSARRNQKGTFFGFINKILPNNVSGMFLRKTLNQTVRLVGTKTRAVKIFSGSNFVDAWPVNDSLVLTCTKKRRALVLNNTVIAAHILCETKYFLYFMYYKVLLNQFGQERMQLACLETDNFILRIKDPNETLLDDLKCLEKYIEFSNIHKSCILFNDKMPYEPLKLKLDSVHVSDFIALRSKQRSQIVLSPDTCILH